jgi:hypothetical protein
MTFGIIIYRVNEKGAVLRTILNKDVRKMEEMRKENNIVKLHLGT